MKKSFLVIVAVLAGCVALAHAGKQRAAADRTWKWHLKSTKVFSLAPRELRNLGPLKEPEGRSSAALVQIEIKATYPVNVAFASPSGVGTLKRDLTAIDTMSAPCKYISVMNLRANCSVPYNAFPVTLVVQDANEAWLTLQSGSQNAVNHVILKLSDYEFR